MERYLLFNSDCGRCTRIARTIEPETKGWLTVKNLRNPDMQILLTKANPSWSWRPTLLEVDGEDVQALTGIQMVWHFVKGLGLFRTLHIGYQLAKEGLLQYAVHLG